MYRSNQLHCDTISSIRRVDRSRVVLCTISARRSGVAYSSISAVTWSDEALRRWCCGVAAELLSAVAIVVDVVVACDGGDSERNDASTSAKLTERIARFLLLLACLAVPCGVSSASALSSLSSNSSGARRSNTQHNTEDTDRGASTTEVSRAKALDDEVAADEADPVGDGGVIG